MIAVMIVSIVIAALFKLRGDTNNLFTQIQQNQKYKTYTTLLLWERDYGFHKKSLNLYRFVENFTIDDDLRRELKEIKIDLKYTKLKSIDLDTQKLEVGRTDFHFQNFELYFNRVILR